MVHNNKSLKRMRYELGAGKKPFMLLITLIVFLGIIGIVFIGGFFVYNALSQPGISLNQTFDNASNNGTIDNSTNDNSTDDNSTFDIPINQSDNQSGDITVDVCEDLDGNEFDECMVFENQEVSYCYNDFECIAQFAQTFDDLTVCDRFDYPAEQMMCKAVAKDNPGIYCEDSGQQRTIDKCYWLYVNLTDDFFYCGSIKSVEQYKTDCYSLAAVNEEDDAYCRNLMSGSRDECYTAYAKQTNDVSVCTKIFVERVNLYSCYYEPALAFGMMSYCENVDASQRNFCYNNVLHLSDKLTPSDCVDVPSTSWREECYLQVALQEDDDSYCQYLKSSSNILECHGYFE